MVQNTNGGLQGTPCWYELMTPDLVRAQSFYADLFGWSIADSGMPGIDYRLATADQTMVAGLMAPPDADMPRFWMIYFAVDDADATARAAVAAGGTVHKGPEDIPGVGRFAVLTDPQGAAFAILQPNPGGLGGAFAPRKPGHGQWNELRSADPEAALAFYGKLFGWTVSRQMDMGPLGVYRILRHGETEIGGLFRPEPGTPSHWLPYFGTSSVGQATERIKSGGGKPLRDPDEVPGGAFVFQALDPQGIAFGLVGGK